MKPDPTMKYTAQIYKVALVHVVNLECIISLECKPFTPSCAVLVYCSPSHLCVCVCGARGSSSLFGRTIFLASLNSPNTPKVRHCALPSALLRFRSSCCKSGRCSGSSCCSPQDAALGGLPCSPYQKLEL